MKRIIVVFVLLLSFIINLGGCIFDNGSSSGGNGTSAGNNGGSNLPSAGDSETPEGDNNGDGDNSGEIITGINISEGLTFYTDGDEDVQLSLDNLRLMLGLITGSMPKTSQTESEATAVFGVRDFSHLGANSHIGYTSVSYEGGILSVFASDIEALNLAKDAVLAFATEEGLIIPEELSEEALFNKTDYRRGTLTLYTEQEAKTLPLATDILCDGELLGGFSSSKHAYQILLDGNTYPTVSALALHSESVVEVTQASEENLGVATVKVKMWEKECAYTFNFIKENATTGAVIVQKGGAKGTVCFVIDDGTHSTAEFVRDNILGKEGYENVNVNFALITRKVATLKTTEDENGELVYDIDEEGRYQYEEVAGEFEFWRAVLNTGNAYIVSHTHTHNPPGENDEGGIFGYKKNDGTWTSTAYLPKGHMLAELIASNQIIEDISGYESGTMIRAGVGASVSKYFYNMMLDSGEYFAARSNSSDMIDNPNQYVYYYNTITNRAAITSYMIEHYASSYTSATVKGDDNEKCLEAGIDKWTGFIDYAIETGGWATFCIHEIKPDDYQKGKAKSGHYIYETQAKALFSHANSYGDDIWIASYDEAAKYFLEWSSASVVAEIKDGNVIAVNLITEETDSRLDLALTVKVTVPDSYKSITLGGESLEIMTDEDGTKYVLVDVKPGETVLLVGNIDLPEETFKPIEIK